MQGIGQGMCFFSYEKARLGQALPGIRHAWGDVWVVLGRLSGSPWEFPGCSLGALGAYPGHIQESSEWRLGAQPRVTMRTGLLL